MSGRGFLSPVFYIGSIRIGTVEGASSVNIGHTTNAGFKSEKKHNQGFGSVSGDNNQFHEARTLLDDADTLDMFSNGPDGEIPEWLKERIINSMENGGMEINQGSSSSPYNTEQEEEKKEENTDEGT
ncbi:hypothetical protein [Evansella clarkii]|uniref:hypothetical protein n=1 Tax=Evansella clarkii TaxID=79879 RepID=UPI001ADC00DA|nr:hypothetical protein [Evansella clarkii]